jgi:hypothetical protein
MVNKHMFAGVKSARGGACVNTSNKRVGVTIVAKKVDTILATQESRKVNIIERYFEFHVTLLR